MKTTYIFPCVCIFVLLLVGVACKSIKTGTFDLNRDLIEQSVKEYVESSEVYSRWDNYSLHRIHVNYPMDRDASIYVTYKLLGTYREEAIHDELFMGFPKGTIESSWATRTFLLNSKGEVLKDSVAVNEFPKIEPIVRQYSSNVIKNHEPTNSRGDAPESPRAEPNDDEPRP